MKKILCPILLAFALNSYAQQTSVAVLPSDGDTEVFNNDDLFALTDKVRSVALKTLPRETFTLLTQDVVVKRLGGAENYVKECRESSCIVDLGKKAQVDYVAQANIGKLRNKMRVKVEVYDVATGGLVGIYDGNGEYFDDYFNLLDAVEKHVPDIFKKIPGVVPGQAKPAPVAPAPSGLSKYAAPAQTAPPQQTTTVNVNVSNTASASSTSVQRAPIAEPESETYTFGIRAGFSINGVSNDDTTGPGIGYSIGYFKNIPISNLSLLLGIDFSYRTLFSYTNAAYDYYKGTVTEFAIIMPAMFKFGSSFYAAAGLQLEIPFMSKFNITVLGEDMGSEKWTERNFYDLGLALGVGFQIGRVAIDLRTFSFFLGSSDGFMLKELGHIPSHYSLGVSYLF